MNYETNLKKIQIKFSQFFITVIIPLFITSFKAQDQGGYIYFYLILFYFHFKFLFNFLFITYEYYCINKILIQ